MNHLTPEEKRLCDAEFTESLMAAFDIYEQIDSLVFESVIFEKRLKRWRKKIFDILPEGQAERLERSISEQLSHNEQLSQSDT